MCEAQAVVCPLDAQDVSRVVQFCVRHTLSPSVKAGGYGTAGWAVAGDIIIDLQHLTDIAIEPPQPGARDWTSLRDTQGKSFARHIRPNPTCSYALFVDPDPRRYSKNL